MSRRSRIGTRRRGHPAISTDPARAALAQPATRPSGAAVARTPDRLTVREREILANPSPLSRAWAGTVKPVYLFVTRRILGWADREGAKDRGSVE